MTLNNYWWLLIWLFGAGLILNNAIPRRREIVLGQVKYRWHLFAAILLVLPYVIWAGFRYRYFGDTGVYIKFFNSAPNSISQINDYLVTNTKDRGFSVLMIMFKDFISSNYTVFFVVVAVFQMISIVYLFRTYSSDFWITFFLFIASTDYLSWMQNGMRQFIAVCLINLGFGLLVKKKYIPVILLILLASTIHGSALIMLPIIFIVQGKAWNRKTILFIIIMIGVVFAIDRFTSFLDVILAETQYSDIVTSEIWTTDNGTNAVRTLVYSVPALLSLVGLRYIRDENNPVLNISVNCAIITMMLYVLATVSSGVYVGRLPIYTTLAGYLCVPWILDHVFEKQSSQVIKIAMILFFVVFFYFQMHYAWSLV